MPNHREFSAINIDSLISIYPECLSCCPFTYLHCMAGNSIGTLFKLTTFGESHGTAIGGILDGCPAGLLLDLESIRKDMARRKPGQSAVTSPRKEDDEFEILSGVFEGQTLGTPIAFMIRNQDYKPSDYENVKNSFRPSHADFTYHEKYGHRDYRGGGRSSARETAARVFAGSIAKQILNTIGTQIFGFVSQVGPIKSSLPHSEIDFFKIESSIVRCPDENVSVRMIEYIENLKSVGDTTGGIVTCVIKNVPVGLGEPVFDKFHADLAKACMSINAAHGFDYGSGFGGVEMKGSEHNDSFVKNANGSIITSGNNSGGIQGGITNGMDVYFRVAFKPVSTLLMSQKTLNEKGEETILEMKGRHDPCVVPRAVPIVEAMTALVLMDQFLRNKNSKLSDLIAYNQA